MTLVIRDSRDEDMPAITAIYADAVINGTASFEIDPPGEAEMRARRERVLAAGLPYLAADLDGRLAGYAYAGRYNLRGGYRWTAEDSIYVYRTCRRRGVARALLQRLIELCEAGGMRQMVAIIGDSANSASIEMHKALGFRLVGILDSVGFKHGCWLNSVIMQRALGDGSSSDP